MSVFNDIYHLLKDDGVLFVGETMIPGLFDIENNAKWCEIVKKWDEAVLKPNYTTRKVSKIYSRKLDLLMQN